MHKQYNITISSNDPTSWTDNKLNKSSFNLREVGIFLYNTNNYTFTEEDARELGLGSNLNGRPFNLEDKTLYRYPKLALPRQKMDLLKDSYNISITRNPDKADIHVISAKFVQSLIDFEWKASLSKRQLYNVLVKMREEDLLHDDLLDTLRITLENTSESDYFKIETKYNYGSSHSNSANADVISKIISENKSLKHRSGIIKGSKNIDMYNKLTATSALIVLDNDIINKVSEGLSIITKDDYESLQQQLLSDDIETRTLAMELMSNCNFEESFDILALLFYFNFDWCKHTTNWTTVNVRTFRNRFEGISGGCHKNNGHAYSRLIQYLKEQDKLTTFAVEICKNNICNDVLKSAGINYSDNSFNVNVDDIYINDSFKDYIKESNIIKKECIKI